MNITLRNNKPEDFDTLHEIDQLCYEDEVAYSKRELRAYLRFRGSECVVAEADGAIAGFCISARQGERGYIVTIDVLPQFRRAHVGTALLEEIERRLVGKRRPRSSAGDGNRQRIGGCLLEEAWIS